MAWIKLDDNFPDHQKVERLNDSAFRLHVSALCHCARNLTDGFVSRKSLGRLTDNSRPSRLTSKLIDAGLWAATEGGWFVHDYLDYNPSAEAVRAERKVTAERVRKWRELRKEPERNTVTSEPRNDVTDPSCNTVTNGVGNGVSNAPPVPSPPGSSFQEEQKPTPKSKTLTRAGGQPDRFDEFWDAYPRRDAKAKAKIAWGKALQRGAQVGEILAAVERYAIDPNREAKFTKNPATWLNGDCWLDDPLPAPGRSARSNDAHLPAAMVRAQAAERAQRQPLSLWEIEA